jgi:hypothetical protein
MTEVLLERPLELGAVRREAARSIWNALERLRRQGLMPLDLVAYGQVEQYAETVRDAILMSADCWAATER